MADSPDTPNHSGTPRCFVAYPSSPADRAESIESAVSELQQGGVVDVIGWKDLATGGRTVINVICDEIKNRELFIADVTGLNPNVLFELGYALARKRRIWLLLNPQIEQAKRSFDTFQLLTTVGYAPYNNSRDIVTHFYKEQPFNTLEQNLFDDLLVAAGPPTKKDSLLYLRSQVPTEATVRIARRVATGPIKSVVDDPQEMQYRPLPWYVQQVNSAYAVVSHLISTEYEHWELHNAKQALVAGIAHGLARPLLMLAHEPYWSPLDYRDLLRRHKTASNAETIFSDWSLPLVEQYEKRIARAANYQVEERARRELRDISLGEPVAENESDQVPDYFVPTAVYDEALRAKYSIIVGRKGTGKTATLYALNEALLSDPRNHVCVIKPIEYELEGLLAALREELSRSEKGYLVESFWKFLLYTELAKSIYEQLLAKPEYYERTVPEATLCEFVEQYRSLITPDFSLRLEAAVMQLHQLADSASEGRRVRISELLHNEMLSRLRVLIGAALQNKATVAVLVDNLDKAWNPNGNLPLLSELLFGLFGASRRIAEDFERDASGRSKVNLHFSLLIRSDIFAAILQYAKEPDKLPAHLIQWNDPELLRRVIEQRFMKGGAAIEVPSDIWERYFIPTIKGVSTWHYAASRSLPKPRDFIFLIKSALQFAVTRGRSVVDESDFRDGEQQYSKYALSSLKVEAAARMPAVDDFLVQFLESSEIVTEEEVQRKLAAAKITTIPLDTVVEWFTELTFLGPEISPNRFEFLYDEQDARKFSVMARKTADETTNGIRRFRIHPAFHSFLEIKPHHSTSPGQLTIGL